MLFLTTTKRKQELRKNVVFSYRHVGLIYWLVENPKQSEVILRAATAP